MHLFQYIYIYILPLVRNTCNTFDVIKNLHREHRSSCVYNKCLIVISRRDTIKRRGSQKKVLPLVLKTCNTFRYVVHFLQRISKPEKNHTGPFSTLKGYIMNV